MEKPHLNNQPKVETGKTPQENEESLNAQEQESGKKENITLEIDGRTIEAVKYYFEYPEQIQKETGILGYERTKIEGQQIFDLVSKLIEEKEGISLEEKGFGTIKDWKNEKDKVRISGKEKLPYLAEKIANHACVDLLIELSNGDYPSYTINHQMSGYAFEVKDKHAKYFKNDKFFLQKLYDTDLLKKDARNQTGLFNHLQSHTRFDIFDKKSGEILLQYISPSNSGKFTAKIDRNEVFATTGDRGLNFSASSFFSNPLNKASFGFAGDIMNEYLDKSLMFLSKNHLNSKENKEVFYNKAITDVVEAIIFNKSYVKDFTLSKDFELNGWEHPIEKTEEYTKLIENIKQSISELESKYGFNLKDVFLKGFGYFKEEEVLEEFIAGRLEYFLSIAFSKEQNHTLTGDGAYEMHIPIFINNDEIIQLQWGHAKYAHYMNEKGLNFFEFKHADHLPSKEELHSSES